MDDSIKQKIQRATHANKVIGHETVQNLWSGYGKIQRVALDGGDYDSIILKHIQLPKEGSHPRGWNTNLSHQRKLKSYQVEMAWYQKWNRQNLNDRHSPTPHCIYCNNQNDELFIILEDLDSIGYSERLSYVSWNEVELCLEWLANFHAKFMNNIAKDLWPTGTYWHLETRPEELAEIKGSTLYKAAPIIDQKLKDSPFQTFVHGDAKLANFCFSKDKHIVAAVDFQYVGNGCGMKDVAYFVGSCLDEKDCEKLENQILEFYFSKLKAALARANKKIDCYKLEKDWRALYPYAWCDFYRFLKGWSPGHWKLNSYSEKISKSVIAELTL